MRIGSNTKTFTGTVVLQLVDEGKLSLNDKVVKYIPEINTLMNGKGAEITIRELGIHTSGVFNYAANPAFAELFSEDPFRAWTPEELVSFALQSEPYFDPGQGFVYAIQDR
jgi:D-alanyl-D-alanine carboxypeptidase